MNRWLFLGGTAVVGLLLYLIFSVNHAENDSSRALYGGIESERTSRDRRWNDLATPALPPPHVPVSGNSWNRPSQPHPSVRTQSDHPLDTRATIYLDGEGPGAPERGGPGGGEAPLVLSAITSVLGKGGSESLVLANKAEEIRKRAGGTQGGVKEDRVPAGSELHAVILKTVDGPGSGIPVIARLTSATLSAFRLPAGTKILGYPETLTPENRLRVRFVRILYPGGFEAHTTGFALSGGREGIPVSVSTHTGGNMARSVAQNSLMLGGEAVDTMGWSGTNVGNLMAMQAGGNALAEAGGALPEPDNRRSFHLDQGTRCSVMILEAFPVPEESGMGHEGK